ncbi:glycosyltransferase family 2 protein [Pseudaminobacter arsenicus]|uniref:Glycosyltransferase family 2 protein n=1 Tax=Borborobacter arsenicus TaxID=1851146 RepID=A0A432V885_9HYPH|nr:glycosyltransferase family A protein [Pseudaminobacter arsenicus]RUM98350.1 glycosyltransferase family 2 protein [Pseudaminobacter arsenicus]
MIAPEDLPASLRIDVCICTYRRRELEDTLLSIGALDVPPNATVRVIVADNDTEPSARDLVYALAARLPFDVIYVHCPASNISIARNACLESASGDVIAFIDDDSTACPQWLVALSSAMSVTGADAVLGPVEAVYSANAPDWMRRGDFHSTRPVFVEGEIHTGYSGNVMLRRSSSRLRGRRFNLALGRTGGEDTEYFTQLYRAGGHIVFAPQAMVHEPVPENRARFSWLMQRRFRSGQTHGRLLGQTRHGAAGLGAIGVAVAKVAYCFALASVHVANAQKRNGFTLRGAMHIGVVGGLLGVREIRQYGEEPAGKRNVA